MRYGEAYGLAEDAKRIQRTLCGKSLQSEEGPVYRQVPNDERDECLITAHVETTSQNACSEKSKQSVGGGGGSEGQHGCCKTFLDEAWSERKAAAEILKSK